MPSASARTTSVTLQCVFRPTTPYTTWTPASSSTRASLMFACSSKRAVSSTSVTTCLPASAALDQVAHERVLGARGAVERVLDREHGRVVGRLGEERLDRVAERFVGMVHEHVALADRREQVGGALDAVRERRRRRRGRAAGSFASGRRARGAPRASRGRSARRRHVDVVARRARARRAAGCARAPTCARTPRAAPPHSCAGAASARTRPRAADPRPPSRRARGRRRASRGTDCTTRSPCPGTALARARAISCSTGRNARRPAARASARTAAAP